MANQSIMAAFERMWQHVITKFTEAKTYADELASNVVYIDETDNEFVTLITVEEVEEINDLIGGDE